jgi:UDP-N-acetylmuramate--alanine ligase
MKKIYFIGINGIGMSGLASIMAQKGYGVSGADINKSNRTSELEKIGVKIFDRHKEENILGMDLVIRSSAIKETNPEYRRAMVEGIKVIKRGELLAFLMNKERGIAVAGTHGKTTTSSMLGALCIPLDPTIVVGGILPEINSNARCGENNLFIAEADESDNSFLYLHPEYSIVTNIEEDHMENHGSYENIEKSFKNFIKQSGEVAVNIDCENLKKLAKDEEINKIITYSIFDSSADIFAKNIEVDSFTTSYELILKGKSLGRFVLSIPGIHNVSNSLPVIYFANKFGVSLDEIKTRLKKFKGARRRFDVLYDKDIKIVDDYAHHPTEIKATLQAVKERTTGKVVAIFQPHRYSRVKFLWDKFEGVFDSADDIILLPTYSAGEENIYVITSEELARKIAPRGNVRVFEGEKEIYENIKCAEEQTMYLFMGAGDISSMAHNITKLLEKN